MRHDVTVDTITNMYLADHAFAVMCESTAAAVAETTGLARLYGLDKQVHHVKNDPIAELLDEVAGNSVGPPSERGKKH